MLDVKKSNHLIGQNILNRKRVITEKEKIILQLYEDLRYNLNENSKLQLNVEESKNLVKEWEKSRNEIVDYCSNLKKKYSDFVKLIEDFEEKIKELHKEKEQMIRINESILEMKGIYNFFNFLANELSQIELDVSNLNKKISTKNLSVIRVY